MSKFEYFVEANGLKVDKEVQERLNKYGNDGWELVAVDSVNGFSRFILKREIESAVGLK